ncbi:bifunctional N(6)-L-threonylcarbamoyladenine synthase/serine/threonine protein kinase [Candidatus Woesearchaeota archaeon]|nr:bifunctional N(6)-L-threonylcarbamoyladenine synthase/serine/threonine protein kinase [Candidatus Woesearchaeota archaeon]
MLCLGIESTAHTFGVGIVALKKGKCVVLANEKDLFRTEKGGFIPAEVAKHHVEVCDVILKRALEKANVNMRDIDLISYSQSPGIGTTLEVGCNVAKSIALIFRKPLVGVNHCIAHLEIGRALCKAKDPVLLYASGANTQVIAYEGKKYRIFGETLDGGIGNYLDKFAREIGLGFPGGPKIEQLALQGKKFISLPYSVKGMDVSFGGIFTNLKQKYDTKKFTTEDLCFSLQETVFAMLIEVAERAMAHTGKKELLLGGGVACNKRLQEMATLMCKERGAKAYWPEQQFLVDNGAMIAWLGILSFKAGNRLEIKDADTNPYLRTDQIIVNWR